MSRRLFLSTPLRNEIDNIDRLYESIEAQDYTITVWVIVENGSTDGSREKLASKIKPSNVENLIILNEDTESDVYALGSKYARLVNRGFEEIRQMVELQAEDMIGILDADSFPCRGYYSAISNAFDDSSDLGIASGLSRDEGGSSLSIHAVDWVRGSCRLWRGKCMLQSGYIIGPSADTLSLARAELDGWSARVVSSTHFFAREVGERAKQQYYGASAYYRGNTLFYVALRFLKFSINRRFLDGVDYTKGYLHSMKGREPRLMDEALRAYFRGYVWRKVRRRFSGA